MIVDECLEDWIIDDVFVDFLELFETEQTVDIERSTPKWLTQDNSVYTMASSSKTEVTSIIDSVMSVSELCSGFPNVRNSLPSCPSGSGINFVCADQANFRPSSLMWAESKKRKVEEGNPRILK